jgi:hypothetical protein
LIQADTERQIERQAGAMIGAGPRDEAGSITSTSNEASNSIDWLAEHYSAIWMK